MTIYRSVEYIMVFVQRSANSSGHLSYIICFYRQGLFAFFFSFFPALAVASQGEPIASLACSFGVMMEAVGCKLLIIYFVEWPIYGDCEDILQS